MDPFSPLIPVFQFPSFFVCFLFFAMDEEVSWMKEVIVGLENAHMAMGQNMSDGGWNNSEKNTGEIPWGQET